MKNILKNIKYYEFGEQVKCYKVVKLNSNENLHIPNIKLIKNLIKEIKFFGNILRFYPDPDSYNSKFILSNYYNIKINEIILSNGSDEILNYIFILLNKTRKTIILNTITYIFYESYIKLYSIKYFLINLKKNFSLKLSFYKNNLYNIIIVNPNANTGKLISKNKIKNILKKNLSSIIILDEAYMDFNKKTNINLIKFFKNLILIKTTSKSKSLAGLRVGYAISNFFLISNLDKIKNSINTYPINILSQKIINFIYKNKFYFNKIKKKIIINKIKFIKLLKFLKFKIINSQGNFILIKHKKYNLNKIIKFLNKNNILIRKFEIPNLENFSRISIGLKKNNLKLFYKIYKLNFFYFI